MQPADKFSSFKCSRGGDAVAAGRNHDLTGAATRIEIAMHRINTDDNKEHLPCRRN